VTGLEPATSGVTGRHSNQLSYTRVSNRNWKRWIYVGCPPRSSSISSPQSQKRSSHSKGAVRTALRLAADAFGSVRSGEHQRSDPVSEPDIDQVGLIFERLPEDLVVDCERVRGGRKAR